MVSINGGRNIINKMTKKNRAKIGIFLLAGILLRSLVASGLMLVASADGFSLILCPTQNPTLATGVLTDGGYNDHHHHHHAAATTNSDELTTDDGATFNAESLDSTCTVWAGSSVVSTKLLSHDVELPPSSLIASAAVQPLSIGTRHRAYPPRAPPLLSS